MLAASVMLPTRVGVNWGDYGMTYTLALWSIVTFAIGVASTQWPSTQSMALLSLAFLVAPAMMSLVGIFLVTSLLLDTQREIEQDAYRSVFDNSDVAILLTDFEGNIQLANPVAEKLLSTGEASTSRLGKLQDHCALQTPLTSLPKRISRVVVDSDNGRPVPVEATWTEVRGQMQWCLRDLTHDELVQNREKQSVKVEAMGLVAGAIAHDFRNVLSAVHYTIDYIGSAVEGVPDVNVAESLNGCQRALVHGQSLANRLTNISKADSKIQLEPVNATEIVQLVHHSYGESNSSAKFLLELPPGPTFVLGESDLLLRALINLCENALQAVVENGGGTVVIGIEQPADNSHVRLFVKDDGPGIAPQVIDRIYEPYFSTKNGGTGLGLFSVRELVSSLNGSVEVHSRIGEGAEFEIFLNAVAVASSASMTRDLAGLQVLCVDDDELSGRMLGLTLETMGCKPVVTNCPEEALEHLRTGSFDLLVTDFSMQPINGIELAESARAMSQNLRIVLTTGYRDILEEKGRIFTGLFADVLTKPVDAGELLRAILGLEATND